MTWSGLVIWDAKQTFLFTWSFKVMVINFCFIYWMVSWTQIWGSCKANLVVFVSNVWVWLCFMHLTIRILFWKMTKSCCSQRRKLVVQSFVLFYRYKGLVWKSLLILLALFIWIVRPTFLRQMFGFCLLRFTDNWPLNITILFAIFIIGIRPSNF